MTTASEFDPIDALEQLGVPNYEARVFVALQKLGTGTAKDVSSIADVPRSQVYGAAESLERRGLIEIQHSTPKTYRPVDLDEARARLRERFERNQERAFEYLETVQNERARSVEAQEGVWRLTGAAAIEGRTVALVDEARDRIVFGAQDPELYTETIVEHLRDRSAAGVDVTVIAEDERTLDRVRGLDVVAPTIAEGDQAGRLLVVDDDTILMSVENDEETAIWSSRSGFARVLVPLVEDAIAPTLDR